MKSIFKKNLNTMYKYRDDDGLCVNCNDNRLCVYSTNNDKPVNNCNEFENINIFHFDTILNNFIDTSVKMNENKTSNHDDGTGLCVNCANKMSCMFSRGKSDINFCEEYVLEKPEL